VGQARSDVDDLRNARLVLEGETLDDGGPLSARIDTDRVVAVGHSAGGGAAYALAADGTVAAYVALASPAGPPEGGSPATVPALFAAGTADAIAQIDRVRAAYEAAAAPKALAELDQVTHTAFTDVCEIGVDRGGVLQIALEAGIPVPEVVLRLYGDSCDPQYTASTDAWPAIRHLTTAHVRAALGIDAAPVGLDDSLAGAYPFAVTWTATG
jgi:pimeloyl-ACP methyl ester carboxylesterase